MLQGEIVDRSLRNLREAGHYPKGGQVEGSEDLSILSVSCHELAGEARTEHALNLLKIIRNHYTDSRPFQKLHELCGASAGCLSRATIMQAADQLQRTGEGPELEKIVEYSRLK